MMVVEVVGEEGVVQTLMEEEEEVLQEYMVLKSWEIHLAWME